jgi:hypothetical protein
MIGDIEEWLRLCPSISVRFLTLATVVSLEASRAAGSPLVLWLPTGLGTPAASPHTGQSNGGFPWESRFRGVLSCSAV